MYYWALNAHLALQKQTAELFLWYGGAFINMNKTQQTHDVLSTSIRRRVSTGKESVLTYNILQNYKTKGLPLDISNKTLKKSNILIRKLLKKIWKKTFQGTCVFLLLILWVRLSTTEIRVFTQNVHDLHEFPKSIFFTKQKQSKVVFYLLGVNIITFFHCLLHGCITYYYEIIYILKNAI